MLEDKTVYCYMHSLQIPVPSADVLGMHNLWHYFMSYTCITKRDSICRYAGFLQASGQNCTPLYTLRHTISFLMAIFFSVLAIPEIPSNSS